MGYRIETTTYAQHQSGIQDVRRRVFIEEQGIDPALEWDTHDAAATFAIAINEQNQVIGTARLFSRGQIGRMAVLPAFRRRGVGTALLLHLLMIAKQRGYQRVELSAQQSIMELYRKQGFKPVGPPYIEVGIPHQRMQCIF